MMTLSRRVLIALSLWGLLAGLALPAQAQRLAAGGPRVLTGSYVTTNPIYPLIGAQTGVVLYDLTPIIQQDYAFMSPPEAQVLGQLNGDIVSGDYVIELPDNPQVAPLDFDGDASTPPAVQVFMTATFINFLGDEYVNRGETPMDMSIRLEPLSYDLVGGHVVVWSPAAGELFPGGMGPDSAAFTADDPRMELPAGWSVISLDTDPFTILRDATVDVPIIESIGALNDYSDMTYLEAWQALFERTRVTYPFTREKRVDWDAVYTTLTPAIKQAESDLAFDLALASLGSLIPDTHIGYVSVPVTQQFLVGGVGIEALEVTDAGEVVVTGVGSGSPADRAGIAAGTVLLAVDGDPALQVLDETPLLLSSASTTHGRRFFQAATMLQGPLGSQVWLKWRALDGSRGEATLIREFDVTALLNAFDTGDPAEGVITSRMLDSGLGYISVRGFAEDVSQADRIFGEALQILLDAGAQGIILDVRDNSGGLIQLAMSIAGRFFPDYVRLFDLYYADGEGGFAYRGFVETVTGEPYYSGPMAVLVNQMTGSAGDMFAYAMQTDNRAIIVGHTPTGGFTGEVSDGQYTLPSGLSMQIPTGRPVDPVTGETLIEGVGVEPDVRVPVTIESLLSDEDEVLRAAEAALLEE